MRQNKLLLFTLFMVVWSGMTSRAQTTFINETFSTATGTTPPTGWTNNTLIGSTFDKWSFNNPGGRTLNSPISSPAAIFDSDNYSAGGGAEDVTLESPTFSTTGENLIQIKFDHYFRSGFGGGAAVEVHDGTSWTVVYSNNSTTTPDPQAITLDVSAQIANKASAKIRFRWTGNYSWYWILDNVQVIAPPPPPPPPSNLYIIDEPFTSVTPGSTPPAGWTNVRTAGDPAFDFWRFGQSGVSHSVGNPLGRSAAAPITGMFAIFDSDGTSSGGGTENVSLESPAVSTKGYSKLRLKWDQHFQAGFGGGANVEVFNGTSWVTVYSTTSQAVNTQDIDVSAHIANKTGVKVRFRWTGNYSWWWIVDNIQLYVPGPTYFIKEPFTTASGSTGPTGWTNNMITGNASYDFWRFGEPGLFHAVGNPAPRNPALPITGKFALFDSDEMSASGGAENVALESPVAVTSGFSSIKLKWDQHFQAGFGGGANVEVFNGTSWVSVYSTTSQAVNTQSIDVSTHVANKTNAKVRFRWTGNYSWWWIVDNAQLYVPVVPNADFTINTTPQCLPGNSFTFTNNTTVAANIATSYSWDFGDATTSTAASPTKTYAAAGTYNVKLTVTNTETGEVGTITKQVVVNPMVTPSVAISAAPGSTICNGTNVTFTATPANGGTTPSYQWKLNGSNVGSNSATYSNAGLANGNTVAVVMTSNAACITAATATSSTTTMTVNPIVTPSVSITSNVGNSFCPGTAATFTATPVNGGASPTYQWKKNGSNVGTNSSTYTDATLTTGDVITVAMTSNDPCPSVATVTSNGITINTSFPASVSIVASPGTTVCAGTNVTFTASGSVPAGSTPIYQWKRNGVNVGTNSTVYTVAPSNGDIITCHLTSSHACQQPSPAISNPLTITHAVAAVPGVTITKTPSTPICPGTAVQFNAVATNGGPAPTYQWKVNGVNVATTSNWGSSSLNNNDVVSVTMTSSICTVPATATANTTIAVNPNTPASVTISANPGTNICSGTGVTFTATPTGGGTPTYQWKRNGVNVGTNSATYNAGTTLTNGNTIEVVMTSTATCALPKTSNSNLITMNVTTTVTPAVSISTIPSGTACVGSVLTFVANPSHGGNTPTYSWKVDNAPVGSNMSTYTDNGSLSAGNHTISVTMTSSVSQCITTTTATGTLIKAISPLVTPTVSISSTQAPGGDACVGSSVTFTSTTTNAGTTPTYQWKKNGVNVATGSSYPAGTTLATGDVITVDMTSSAACASPVNVTSAPVNITVWPNVTASVTISSNPANNVGCTSLPVTFTATPVNVGSNPTYQWKKNGSNVGTNSPTYTDAGLVTGNTISCQVTTSIPCATPKPATSNTLTMTMNPVVASSINLSVTPDSVGCEKTPFTFNTFHTNGGTNPAFKWYKNGTPIPGAAQAVYSSNGLVDGDVIACELTSNAVCVFPVMSAPMTIGITPSPVPTLSIAGVPDADGINFVATLTDGGQNPTFQWRKNGHDIPGATAAVYKGLGLSGNDKINVFAHADIECANPEFLLSNTLEVAKVTAINTVTTSFDELTLFPNPNGGRFTIKGTAKATANSKAIIEVLNAVGQVVYKDAAELKGHELEVEVYLGGHNAAGMYMLRVTVDGHTDNLRFMVND